MMRRGSLAGRQALLGQADALDIAVIKDRAYQALRDDGTPVLPVMALDVSRSGGIGNTRSVYPGLFSKTLPPDIYTADLLARAIREERVALSPAGPSLPMGQTEKRCG